MACPFPTAQQGGRCILTDDIRLNVPLELASTQTLDCQGHKISPAAPGQPQLAIFLNEVRGVVVKNCDIEEGFDHGILAINMKEAEPNEAPGREHRPNKIMHNTIKANYVAINLISSDNFEITENVITFFNRGGAAVNVLYNSDGNIIADNTITGELRAVGARMVPGPQGAANPQLSVQVGAVAVTQAHGPQPSLFNVVIQGNPPRLYQLTVPDHAELNEDFTADNLIERNRISYDGSAIQVSSLAEAGIIAVASLRTIVRANEIQGPMGPAIRDGQQTSRVFPGTCSLDANRLCLDDGGCAIPGIDDGASKGTCLVIPRKENLVWFARDLLVEDNEILGPILAGLSIGAENVIIRRNTIMGPLNAMNPLGGIVLRGKFPLETGAVVTRNLVSNVSIALRLDTTFGLSAAFAEPRISLNDFLDYTTAVSHTGSPLPVELSVDDQGNACGPNSTGCLGNHWGLSCEENGGFDPSKVTHDQIVDSYPFPVEVREVPEGELPLTCS